MTFAKERKGVEMYQRTGTDSLVIKRVQRCSTDWNKEKNLSTRMEECLESISAAAPNFLTLPDLRSDCPRTESYMHQPNYTCCRYFVKMESEGLAQKEEMRSVFECSSCTLRYFVLSVVIYFVCTVQILEHF